MIMDEARKAGRKVNFGNLVHKMRFELNRNIMEYATSDYFLENYFDQASANHALLGVKSLCLFRPQGISSLLSGDKGLNNTAKALLNSELI